MPDVLAADGAFANGFASLPVACKNNGENSHQALPPATTRTIQPGMELLRTRRSNDDSTGNRTRPAEYQHTAFSGRRHRAKGPVGSSRHTDGGGSSRLCLVEQISQTQPT